MDWKATTGSTVMSDLSDLCTSRSSSPAAVSIACVMPALCRYSLIRAQTHSYPKAAAALQYFPSPIASPPSPSF